MARARFSIGIEMRPNALTFLALILQGARRRSQNSLETPRACKMESATYGTRSKPIFPPQCALHLRCRCLHALSPPHRQSANDRRRPHSITRPHPPSHRGTEGRGDGRQRLTSHLCSSLNMRPGLGSVTD
jgi:hypothetical protein